MIKPIETSYKGYRFRSRTEARFAVYLDFLGIKWEYELEGYELPSGSRYLPDFYLPEIGLWIEIKSSVNLLTIKELKKILEFGSEHKIAIAFGIPGSADKESMYIIDRCDYYMDILEETFEETKDEKISIKTVMNYISGSGPIRFSPCPISHDWIVIYHHEIPPNYYLLCKAIDTARAARFEFNGQ